MALGSLRTESSAQALQRERGKEKKLKQRPRGDGAPSLGTGALGPSPGWHKNHTSSCYFKISFYFYLFIFFLVFIFRTVLNVHNYYENNTESSHILHILFPLLLAFHN